jgi:integrase
MARRSTGQVVERKTKRGTVYALRFYAGGERQYLTLGTPEEGWNRRRAEDELAATMAAVRAGTWEPPKPVEPIAEPGPEPTFHEFASQWLNGRRGELRPRTVADYTWALSYHLLPRFKAHRLSGITVAEVDGYKAAKLAEGLLGAAQINKTLKLLAQILDMAIEYGHLDAANPARGRRRRVKQPKPRRSWVEPEQLGALLDAADEYHRPILATLAGAGLRIGEALALDWRDVNLATGTLRVGRAKTDAGTDREVDLPGGLVDALGEWKARTLRSAPADPVFISRSARRQTDTNVDHRLKGAIKRANEQLAEAGIDPISERVSPHSLRRTYASLRAALRDDPVYIAEQLGHTDPAFTFRVYQKAAKRRERLSGAYLEAFDQALEWALMGTSATSEAPSRLAPRTRDQQESAS